MEENKEAAGLKILLMGKAKVGKTSMRSIIFANKAPEETKQLEFTQNVNETHSKFLGKLYLIYTIVVAKKTLLNNI